MLAKTLACAMLMIWATDAAAGSVRCNVVCADGKACKTSDRPALLKTSVSLNDCESPSRKVDVGCADVLYYSRHIIQFARVCTNGLIAKALKDPDSQCSFIECLMPLPPKPAPAGHPIGSDDQSSTSSGAKAGLPFDTILAPQGALRLSATGASARTTGKFSIWDAKSPRLVVAVAIEGGQATLPPAAISPQSAYRYKWEAGSQVLEGTFLTASASARAEVEEDVRASAGGAAMSDEQRQWRWVYMLAGQGYAWDAMQTTMALQRGQEVQP